MEKKKYLMPIPAGTPYSIISEAVNKFGVELTEVPIKEAMMDNENPPMMWVLRGNYENLVKAKEFIIEKLKEVLKKFE